MDQIRLELDELGRMLREELSHERMPSIRKCEECIKVKHELETARKSCKAHLDRVHDLEKQVAIHKKLKDENDSLKHQLVRDVDQPSYQSVVGELAIEKQRRIRAEQELEIHRKQGRTADEKLAANAKRVAIALAQHCLELSQELHKLKNVNNARSEAVEDQHVPAITNVPGMSTEPLGAPPKVAGWGMDDDIFDEPN